MIKGIRYAFIGYRVNCSMVAITLLFGSASDEPVIAPLAEELKKKGISFEARICSAHRTPRFLEKIVRTSSARLFIAGAGLSAALPGTIASQTIRPVIGISIAGNYGGLDALLAIHQMPPGIPVLGTGVACWKEAANQAASMLAGPARVMLVTNKCPECALKSINSCKSLLTTAGIVFETKTAPQENAINIHFVEAGKEPVQIKGTTICVPVAQETTPLDATKLAAIKTGLWVGLGRGENAALAALQIIALRDPKIARQISDYRRVQQQKVLASDKKIKKSLGDKAWVR